MGPVSAALIGARTFVLRMHVVFDLLFDDALAARLETLLTDLNVNVFLGHFRLSSDKRQFSLLCAAVAWGWRGHA